MRKFEGRFSSNAYIEIFSDEKGSLLEHVCGDRVFFTREFMRDYLTEIKEPVKLTVWKNVWQRKDGLYFFGCDWPDEQSAKTDGTLFMSTNKYIKTVKFEVEFEQ